jgi:hypothetical protein
MGKDSVSEAVKRSIPKLIERIDAKFVYTDTMRLRATALDLACKTLPLQMPRTHEITAEKLQAEAEAIAKWLAAPVQWGDPPRERKEEIK